MNTSRAPGTTRVRRHRLDVLARECVRAHDSGERIAIGDTDSSESKLGGARDHLLGMRGPAQKRKIRHRRKFGEPRLKPDQGRRSWAWETDRIGPHLRAG